MQRLLIVAGLVAAAVMLQGCTDKAQAMWDHGVAVTSSCYTAVDEKLKPTNDKFSADSQAYCDTLTDTAQKAICVLKRTQYQASCGAFYIGKWKLACVTNNSQDVMNATAIEAAVTTYIDATDTEATYGMASGFVTMTESCNTEGLTGMKEAVAASTSRLYDATTKPKAAEAKPPFLATAGIAGFATVMVVGSVAFGVKRFLQNRKSAVAEDLEENFSEVE